MLQIRDLHVYVENKHIVKGVSLTIKPSQVHVLIGPNGSGKSSLANALMGKPNYKADSQIILDRRNIARLATEERVKRGLFLVFQHPVSIAGVSVFNIVRIALQNSYKKNKKSSRKNIKDMFKFNKWLIQKAEKLGIKESILKRSINQGFSGGEKKKVEMLQLITLKPKYAIIDEIDTGLDIDALELVAKAITRLVKKYKTGTLLITHYQRVLKYIKPDFVHVMIDGKIVKSGNYKLAEMVENKGYKIFKSANC